MNITRFKKIKKVLEKRQPDLSVLMDNIHKPHNLSAIARTCDAIGIYDIHATAYSEKIDITQKTSGGVKKWTRFTSHDSVFDAVNHLKNQGHQVVAAHLTKNSVDFRDIDYTKKTTIIMGAELQGVSEDAINLCDKCIHIPMYGMTQSLNVSVACSIILFEAERQRKEKGMYNQIQLSNEEFESTLFEWMYPDIALFCKRRNLRYPEFSMETGQLLKRFSTAKYYETI